MTVTVGRSSHRDTETCRLSLRKRLSWRCSFAAGSVACRKHAEITGVWGVDELIFRSDSQHQSNTLDLAQLD